MTKPAPESFSPAELVQRALAVIRADRFNELHLSGGGHTWINWRHYLNEFAPQLFRG